MVSRFSPPANLVLLCGVIVLGPTTVDAAGIGVHLRGHAQTFHGPLQGDTTRMSAWEWGRAGAVATAPEHEKYSARYSGRKYGDQIAQMSDRRESFTSIARSEGYGLKV